MSDNPYQTPSSGFGEINEINDIDADAKSEVIVKLLQQTRPWVRFISILLFLTSGFLVLGGLVMMVSGPMTPMGRIGVTIGAAYIVMALIYFVPAIFLWKYADRITLFERERSMASLTLAVEAQKSFWKFVGIAALILLVLYFGGITLGMIMATF